MKTPFPYWVDHSLVALTFCVINHLSLYYLGVGEHVALLAGVYSGSWYYLGREVRDVEKLHNWNFKKFDYKGIIAPLGLMILYFFIFKS